MQAPPTNTKTATTSSSTDDVSPRTSPHVTPMRPNASNGNNNNSFNVTHTTATASISTNNNQRQPTQAQDSTIVVSSTGQAAAATTSQILSSPASPNNNNSSGSAMRTGSKQQQQQHWSVASSSSSSQPQPHTAYHPLSSFSAQLSSVSSQLAIEALSQLVETKTSLHGRCVCCCPAAAADFARFLAANGSSNFNTIASSSNSCQNSPTKTAAATESLADEKLFLTFAPSSLCTCTAATKDGGDNSNSCCATVLRFAASLTPSMRAIFGNALLLEIEQSKNIILKQQQQIAASTTSSSATAAVKTLIPRYALAVLVASVAQEFFSFWEELPNGIADVSLAAQPRVVGIGGEFGSVVMETTVTKKKNNNHDCEGGRDDLAAAPGATGTASSSSSVCSSVASTLVVPQHVKGCENFCVKVTRITSSGVGWRTPVRVASSSSSGKLSQQHQQLPSRVGSTSSVSSLLDGSAALVAIAVQQDQPQQQQPPQQLPNSVQERQFYGVVKAAAALRPDIASLLLVPIASVDPRRFGTCIDPPTVAQCLLLERWDGDLRWAKETYAAVTPSKQPQQQLPPKQQAQSATETAATSSPPVAIPSFLRKFAAPASLAVPPAEAAAAAPASPKRNPTTTDRSATATVEIPSFLKKFAAVPSKPSNGSSTTNNEQQTSTLANILGGGTNDEAQSSPTSSLLHESNNNSSTSTTFITTNFSIFNTRRKFNPVLDFESLGCVAFQLFSALDVLHNELPHLSETISPQEQQNPLQQQLLGGTITAATATATATTKRSLAAAKTERRKPVLCSGYVHNDIHSGNILVRLGDRRVCLCDFEHVTDIVVTPVVVAAQQSSATFPDINQQQQQHQTQTQQPQPPPFAEPEDIAHLLDGGGGGESGGTTSTTPGSPFIPECNSNHNSNKPPRSSSSSTTATSSRTDSPATQNLLPFRVTPRAYTPPELVSAPKRDVWAATLIIFELFVGICPLVNALEAGNDMSDCYLTVDEEHGLDWRHFESLLSLAVSSPSSSRRAQFLDFCSRGLRNDPARRCDARQMLEHPFLSGKTAQEWNEIIVSKPPFFKQQ